MPHAMAARRESGNFAAADPMGSAPNGPRANDRVTAEPEA